MNVKYFLLFAVSLLFAMAANAQNQEPNKATAAVREFATGVEVRELSHHNPSLRS